MPHATPEPSRAFEDPELAHERRIDDLLARMSLAEKVACFSTNPSVPRLGVLGSRHVEGLHGLALGGPGNWGRNYPVSTTTFPQAVGLAQSWSPELLRRAAVEAVEARFVFHQTQGLSNVGERAGDEVVQMYATRQPAQGGGPLRELVGFQRIWLEAGQTRVVMLTLPHAQLARFDRARGRALVEGGELELAVGRSSAALELSRVLSVRPSVELES